MKKRENEEKQTGMTEKHFRTRAVHTHTQAHKEPTGKNGLFASYPVIHNISKMIGFPKT